MWTPKRIILLAICFVLFLLVYILYSLTSLGRINTLPPLPDKYKPTASDDASDSNIDRGPYSVKPKPLELKLEKAFNRGCEELKWPVQLELSSKSMVLAAGKCEVIEDGRVLLEPMSLALFGKKKNDGREIEINTLKCKQAYLRFDRRITGFSPSEMSGRKIVEAELFGDPQTPIHITNNRRTTVREDDLEVTITNGPLYYIEKTQLVKTSDHVHLRDGLPTERDGQLIPPRAVIDAQGMEMELATSAPPPRPGFFPAPKPKNETISGVKRIILKEDVVMFLYVTGGTPFPGSKANGERPSAEPRRNATAEAPRSAEPAHIHIVCPGRFEYELFKDHDMARFDVPIDADQATSPQDVRVERINKQTGNNDMLVCKHLEMRLKRRGEGAPNAGGVAAEEGVEIETAHATGPFVTLFSDSEKLDAHCTDLFHDTAKKFTVLKGVPHMEANKGDSHIQAPELHLQEMPLPAEVSSSAGASDQKKNAPAKTYQQVQATGPGSIHMTNKTTGKQTVHAYWNDKLTSTRDWPDEPRCPREGMDLLILEGAARFEDEEHGQSLQAEMLKVWLLADDKKSQAAAKPVAPSQSLTSAPRGVESKGTPKPPAAAKQSATPEQARRPHLLEAKRNVRARSAELNIHDTARLVVHFTDVPLERMPPPSSSNGKPAAPPPVNKAAAAPAPVSASRPVSPPASVPPVAGGQKPVAGGQKPVASSQKPIAEGQKPIVADKKPASENQPIDLSATSIEAKVLRCEERMVLDKLWAAGGALDNIDKHGGVIVRQAPAKPGEEGVYIEGNTLDMSCTAAGNKLHVTGDLARLRMDKIFILGPEVNIDQVANKAWVDGEGAMQMQSDKTMDGKPLAHAVPLTIHWSQSMVFFGTYAEFEGSIQAEQENARLACQHLQVLFDRPISLKEGMRGDQPAKMSKLVADKADADQNVRVEDQTFEHISGKLEKYQLMIGGELYVDTVPRDDGPPHSAGKNNDANLVKLSGPGSVRILQRGDADLAVSSNQPAPNRPAPPKPAGQEQEMKLTYISFWKQMQANSETNVASFWESVRVLTLPCDDPHREIDLDDMLTKELPPGAMYLRCSRTLKVGSIQRNGRTYQWMDAVGQVYVQGREFTAQCDHMTFNEEKDQVIFLGENDNPAVLSKGIIKGQRPQTVRAPKIIYYRTTGQIEVPVLGSFGG